MLNVLVAIASEHVEASSIKAGMETFKDEVDARADKRLSLAAGVGVKEEHMNVAAEQST